MGDESPEFEVFVERIRRALDTRFTQAKKNFDDKHPITERLRSPGGILQPLLREDYPDVVTAASTAMAANGRGERDLNNFAKNGSTIIENVLRYFVEVGGEYPDAATISRQAAEFLSGRPLPLHEHVVIDIGIPVPRIPLFGGWELYSAGRENDPIWRLDAPPIFYASPGAGSLHRAGFGELRRRKPARALHETPRGTHDLLWPLIALNLYGPSPVRAFTAYQVEPGRRLIEVAGFYRAYVPAEISAWHPDPLSVVPGTPRALDTATGTSIACYATEVGALLDRLTDADRRAFGRAAEHLLYLSYHQNNRQAELDGSYVAFRRIVAIEILLTGGDKDQGSIARRVSQRAAVLVGEDDNSRLTVQALLKAAYGARSAFAHGSQGSKTVDDIALARVTRLIMRRWLALSSIHHGRELAALLDDALLSVTVRDNVLQTIADHERRAGIASDTAI